MIHLPGDCLQRRHIASMHIAASPAFRFAEKNPYTSQLYEHLQRRGHRVEDFTPSGLLRDRPDVWHLHWPDYQVSMAGRLQVGMRIAALTALLGLAKAKGTRVVWTAHNVSSHERRHPFLERWLWRAVFHSVDGIIALSDFGAQEVRRRHPTLRHVPCAVIPHGHYRDVYGHPADKAESRARLGLPSEGLVLLHLGQLRPYKNVHRLIEAFADAQLPEAVLVVAGQPIDTAMKRSLERAVDGMSNVMLQLEFVPRDEVRWLFSACDLVVLPYTDFSNSGAAILSLSFDRPIVVPPHGAMMELQEWYGQEWVRTYEGRISGEVLKRETSGPLPTTRLALPQLEWPVIAEATEKFYGRLLAGNAASRL
jgi:beta-1,4-mannosyltransferase